jgi:uncharacterized protein (DUF486 family)
VPMPEVSPRDGLPATLGRARGALGDNAAFATFPPSLPSPMNPVSPVLHPAIVCAVLLSCSNLFMTIAWYGHLKTLSDRPWWIAALISWGIALFEYLLQVPANRVGFTVLSLSQLKILQEVITLAVFVPFAMLFMGATLKLDYLWAALCLTGAVYFVFRS